MGKKLSELSSAKTKTQVVEDTTKDIEEVNEKVVQSKTIEPKKVMVTKEYKPDDLILCRSVTQGELLLPGKKSGLLYIWSNFGDVTEVEYQDLYALKSNKSSYIFLPHFVIDDEEFMSQTKWQDVQAIYDSMYDSEDLDAILNLLPPKFKSVLKQLPVGMQNVIKIEAATRIEAGTFDSINKIKIIDEVCGTDLMCLLR